MDRNVKNELTITLVQTKLKSTTTGIEGLLKHMRELCKYYVEDYKNLLIYGKPNTYPPAKEIQPFGREKLKSKNIQAVFILFAQTTKLRSTKNVCIINRDQLIDVYGPTIYKLV